SACGIGLILFIGLCNRKGRYLLKPLKIKSLSVFPLRILEKKMSDKHILTDIPMPILTPRLILRPAMPGDGAALHEAKTETYEDLAPWMPWAKKDEPAEESEIVVRRNYAKFILREDLMLLGFHRDTGEFVLGTGLHRFDFESGRFEIGYWVRKKY